MVHTNHLAMRINLNSLGALEGSRSERLGSLLESLERAEKMGVHKRIGLTTPLDQSVQHSAAFRQMLANTLQPLVRAINQQPEIDEVDGTILELESSLRLFDEADARLRETSDNAA